MVVCNLLGSGLVRLRNTDGPKIGLRWLLAVLCLLWQVSQFNSDMVLPPRIEVIDMNRGNGFTIIQLNETRLIDYYGHFVHKINLTQFEENIIVVEKAIRRTYFWKEYSSVIDRIKDEFESLLPHPIRHRRQVIPFVLGGAAVASMVYGYISHADLKSIQDELDASRVAHNEIVKQNNQQIIINARFEQRYNTLVGTFNANMKKIKSRTREMEQNLSIINKQILRLEYEIMFKESINNIFDEIHKIKEILMLARLGVLSRDILTPNEMREQNISLTLLMELELKIGFYDNCILLIIEVPHKTQETYKNVYLQPLPNKDKQLQLNIEPNYFLMRNNSFYLQTKHRSELKAYNPNNCHSSILSPNLTDCRFVQNKDEDVILLQDTTLITINLREQQLEQDCNSQSISLMGTNIIKFRNCQIKINGKVFRHYEPIDQTYDEHVILPNTIRDFNYTDVTNMTLESVHKVTIENLKYLHDLQFTHTQHSNLMYSLLAGIYLCCAGYFVYRLGLCMCKRPKGSTTTAAQKSDKEIEPGEELLGNRSKSTNYKIVNYSSPDIPEHLWAHTP